MFGRTLKLSIAKDNGRSVEFDSKRTYADKQQCYECGEEGHLSYKCPINVLGNRDIPTKNTNKKRSQLVEVDDMQTISTEFEGNRFDEDVSSLPVVSNVVATYALQLCWRMYTKFIISNSLLL